MKLFVIYNMCQIGNRGNVPYYINSIQSLLDQDMDDYRVVLSGCMMTPEAKAQLHAQFQDKVSYNFINESLPLSVTFNHTVQRSVREFGDAQGYLYVDSGITLWNTRQGVRTLFEGYSRGDVGIIAAMPSNDDGREWWGIKYKFDEDFTYPVGKATNMHCQIFSHAFYEAFDKRILPDIFANDSSESIFSFMCAALKKKYVMLAESKLKVLHAHSMDGASVGWRNKGFLFRNPGSTKEAMTPIYERGKEFGFGYEECDPQKRWMHDPAKFDENGFALDPRLKDFIRDNCFVRDYNYDWVSHQFIK